MLFKSDIDSLQYKQVSTIILILFTCKYLRYTTNNKKLPRFFFLVSVSVCHILLVSPVGCNFIPSQLLAALSSYFYKFLPKITNIELKLKLRLRLRLWQFLFMKTLALLLLLLLH